jgi:hypothetical protein
LLRDDAVPKLVLTRFCLSAAALSSLHDLCRPTLYAPAGYHFNLCTLINSHFIFDPSRDHDRNTNIKRNIMPITAKRAIAANEEEERRGLLFVLLVR